MPRSFCPTSYRRPSAKRTHVAGRHGVEPGLLSPGTGFAHGSVLEEFGGVAEPGLIDVGDGNSRPLPGPAGLTTAARPSSTAASARQPPSVYARTMSPSLPPVRGVDVASARVGRGADRGGQGRLVHLRPGPFAARAVLLLQAISRFRALASGSRADRARAARRSASSASLSWGQNSCGSGEEVAGLGLRFGLAQQFEEARIAGRGGGEAFPDGLPRRPSAASPASRPRPVRRHGRGRSRSRHRHRLHRVSQRPGSQRSSRSSRVATSRTADRPSDRR